MNSQLLTHLETFDSDDEFSESPALHEEEHVAPLTHDLIDPLDTFLLRTKARFRKYIKPRSLKEAVARIAWLLPVGIILGEYIGLLLSLNLALMCVVIMQYHPSEHIFLHPSQDGDQKPAAKTKISVEPGANVEKCKEQLHDCRKDLSRLLGLVGAPPLEWLKLDSVEEYDDARNDVEYISEAAMVSLINFLEAHVQLLLSVDEAYHWIRISASLHLGLGPMSQCVERVERASVAREFRNRSNQSTEASFTREGITSQGLPQRGGSVSATLSLANVRSNLATFIVNQGDSLLEVWKTVREAAATAGTPGIFPHVDSLVLPAVVDLAWIKISRFQLNSVLSHMCDHFGTLKVLHTLTESLSTRSKLDESTCNARNAREQMLCNLLLVGKGRFVSEVPDPNDPLLLSLLQYREQLDALVVALWACQHARDFESNGSSSKFECEDKQSTQTLRYWWTKATELGATCQALQQEINQNYFLEPPLNSSTRQEVEGNAGDSVTAFLQADDMSEDFVHNMAELVPERAKFEVVSCSKSETTVFKGNGSMNDRCEVLERKVSGGCHSGASSGLPSRDSVSEHMLVRELQERIQKLPSAREDKESPFGSDTEEYAEGTQMRERSSACFLGASGSLLSELKQSIPSQSVVAEESIILCDVNK